MGVFNDRSNRPLFERGMNEYCCLHRVSLMGLHPVGAKEWKDPVGVSLLLFNASQLFILIKDQKI